MNALAGSNEEPLAFRQGVCAEQPLETTKERARRADALCNYSFTRKVDTSGNSTVLG